MAIIKIDSFAGEFPKADAHKIADGASTDALNCEFRDGTLRGVPVNETDSFYNGMNVNGTPLYPTDFFHFDDSHVYAFDVDSDAVRAPGVNLEVPRWYRTEETSIAPIVSIIGHASPNIAMAPDTGDLVGVPRPTVPPKFSSSYSPFGNLVAAAELFLANERENGDLTEKTRISSWRGKQISLNSFIPAPEESVTTPIYQKDRFTASTAFLRVPTGVDPTPDVLRNYGALITNGTLTNPRYTYSGGQDWGTHAYQRGVLYVGHSLPMIGGQNSGWTWTGGDELPPDFAAYAKETIVKAVFADSSNTVYMKLNPDMASSDTITRVIIPHVPGSLHPPGGFTFTRCTSREGQPEKSLWYYATNSPALMGNAQAYAEAKLCPVIANCAESSASKRSLGVVLLAYYWLAVEDKDGSITGVSGQRVDDIYIDWLQRTNPNAVSGILSKLQKLTLIIREDRDDTLPDNLPKLTFTPRWLGKAEHRGMATDATPIDADYYNYDISISAPDDEVEARAYVYTYVNEWGEEGAPSEPLFFDSVPIRGRVCLELNYQTWEPYRYAPCSKIRLYRTATGTSTEFLFVDEFDVTKFNGADGLIDGADMVGTSTRLPNGTWVDSKQLASTRYDAPTVITTKIDIPATVLDSKATDELAEPISTVDYYPPPLPLAYYAAKQAGQAITPDMQRPVRGLVALHNGMVGFFERNNVFLSEPYLPYAYNPNYIQTLPDDVVGLMPFENVLYVVTKGHPFVLSGNSPDTLINAKIPAKLPGVSRRAIVNIGSGIAYASTEGLVLVSGMNASLSLSDQIFGKLEWLTLWSGSSSGSMLPNLGMVMDDSRLLVYGYDAAGFSQSIIIDMANPNGGVVSYAPASATASYIINAFTDQRDGQAYVVEGRLNQPTTYVTKRLMSSLTARSGFVFATKHFYLPTPASFGALQIEGTGTVAVEVFSGSWNTGADTELLGSAIHTQMMTLNGRTMIRLPAVRPSRRWKVKVTANAGTQIYNMALASVPAELKRA